MDTDLTSKKTTYEIWCGNHPLPDANSTDNDLAVSWNFAGIELKSDGLLAPSSQTIPWNRVRLLKISEPDPKTLQRFLEIRANYSTTRKLPLSQLGDRIRIGQFKAFARSMHVEMQGAFFDEQDKSVDEDLTIPFWPYCEMDRHKQKKLREQAGFVVCSFVILWLCGVLFAFNWHVLNLGGGWYSFVKFIPLMLLPLYARGARATQLTCTQAGIRFEAQVAGTTSIKRVLPWKDIEEIFVTPRSSSQRILDQFVCFRTAGGQIVKLKLEKIATARHWKDLMAAFERWSTAKLTNVDRDLFDNLNVDQRDPTYTQLWLDALSAPPGREKLQALKEGVSLQSGKYVLVEKLGTGGQGSAYLARTDTGERVVLKEYILPVYVDAKVRRRALENFEHEASMLRSLDHPNIVTLQDFFIEDHRGYLVLEYIDGLNLRDLVARDGPLQEKHVQTLAVTMCDVLSYLHSQSPPIVHRDFTPDNLILSADGSLKLIDFMVAQQNTDTATATVVGKHAYLPPEQFRGRALPASDIYGLGCTLYYLLTGKDPEPLTTSHPILLNDAVSGGMDEIVARATELDTQRRYQSAGGVGEALMELSS